MRKMLSISSGTRHGGCRRLASLLVAGALLGAATLPAAAQGVPINSNFFGINYWYNQPNATVTADLKTAGITFYRVGGNERNKMSTATTDAKEDYAATISYIKNTLLGEPLMQLPIGLPNDQVDDWVTYFKARGVSYYTIGNEPDPTPNDPDSNLDAWVDQEVDFEGYSFYDFRGRFKEIARIVKLTDNNCKIVGGDFRNFYDKPISLYYSKFIGDVGDEFVTVGTRKIPLLDVFSFHYYDTKGHREGVLKARFDAIQGYLDVVNNTRDNIDNTWTDLRMAVTELNAEAKLSTASIWRPYGFGAGQFVATMTKLALEKRAFCVTPWSIYENDGSQGSSDFSLYNLNNTRRSTMHHFALISQNKRANYMPGAQSGYADDIVFLGMRDTNGYTVLLMNTSATGRSVSVSLNNQYQGTNTVRVKLEGYGSVSNNFISDFIPARSTFLYRLNAAGSTVTSKLIYDDNDAAPHARSTASLPAGGPTEAPAPALSRSAAAQVLAYPNPATSKFVLGGMQAPSHLTLTNATGQVLQQQAVAPGEVVDVSRLPQGLYWLSIRTEQGETRQKLLKQ